MTHPGDFNPEPFLTKQDCFLKLYTNKLKRYEQKIAFFLEGPNYNIAILAKESYTISMLPSASGDFPGPYLFLRGLSLLESWFQYHGSHLVFLAREELSPTAQAAYFLQ